MRGELGKGSSSCGKRNEMFLKRAMGRMDDYF